MGTIYKSGINYSGGGGETYTAGDGIDITNNEISADFATDTEIANILTLVFGS